MWPLSSRIFNLQSSVYFNIQWSIQSTVCLLSCFSRDRLFEIPRTVVHHTPLSMEFSRQEYWSGLPCPPPGALPNPGIESASLVPPELADRFFTTSATSDISNSKLLLKKTRHWTNVYLNQIDCLDFLQSRLPLKQFIIYPGMGFFLCIIAMCGADI